MEWALQPEPTKKKRSVRVYLDIKYPRRLCRSSKFETCFTCCGKRNDRPGYPWPESVYVTLYRVSGWTSFRVRPVLVLRQMKWSPGLSLARDCVCSPIPRRIWMKLAPFSSQSQSSRTFERKKLATKKIRSFSAWKKKKKRRAVEVSKFYWQYLIRGCRCAADGRSKFKFGNENGMKWAIKNVGNVKLMALETKSWPYNLGN